MDYTKSEFWIAIGVGGGIVAMLSTIQQLTNKDHTEPYSGFRVKPVVRDFLLGAFVMGIVYMLIPDSIQNWVSSAKTMVGGALPQSSPSSFDIELQTGPARF